MGKIKKLFTNWRVLLLIAALLVTFLLIQPHPHNTGVAIKSVQANSLAAFAGIEVSEDVFPVSWEHIVSMNAQDVKTLDDYYHILQDVHAGDKIYLETQSHSYFFFTKKNAYVIDTATLLPAQNETNMTNVSIPVADNLGLHVVDAVKSNIKTGLDLQGGTRILLETENVVTSAELETIRENVEKRLVAFGFPDVQVSATEDSFLAEHAQYIWVQIAGAKANEVESVITQQGEFKAEIAGQEIFTGADIKAVGASGTTSISGITNCQASTEGYSCAYNLPVTLSTQAAQNQAAATKDLDVVTDVDGSRRLSERIIFYLDGTVINNLSISAGLKGAAETTISITGGASGTSQQKAADNALAEMKELKTILQTGNLASKLHVVKTDTISATLGSSFIENALHVALAAIIGVIIVIGVRYRKIQVVIPVVLISLSEILILLGFISVYSYVDLAAIAGMIIIIGSSLDHQIILTDQTLQQGKATLSWKRRLKDAFGIIFIAFSTTFVAMLPIWFAGAGMLSGFALTTIVGLVVGILITRPAYGAIIQILLEK